LPSEAIGGQGGAKGSIARVRQALADLGLETEFRTFEQNTRTATEAAAAIGCEIGQIAKSLVFRSGKTDRAILVVASGSNRVDEAKLAKHLGESIAKADAAFVRERTGFSIGAVAPVGHVAPVRVLIDSDLLRFREIWAAAGSSNSVFRLKPADLSAVIGGEVVALAADSR
jgi:prolyl-tRNA editing enzyme YbaK/EbsC (Cys-tRNA(Pro) deacylase)